MKTVYLVQGSTGEYSDHTTWAVACYPSRDVADLHARKANEWLKERKIHENDDGVGMHEYYGCGTEWDEEKTPEPNPWDRMMTLKYTGGKYTVAEVPFCLHPDQYQEEAGVPT